MTKSTAHYRNTASNVTNIWQDKLYT